jgi:hypothetical protein
MTQQWNLKMETWHLANLSKEGCLRLIFRVKIEGRVA